MSDPLDAIRQAINDALAKLKGNVQDAITDRLAQVGELIGSVAEMLLSLFNDAFTQVKGTLDSITTAITNRIQEVIDTMAALIADAIGVVWDQIAQVRQQLADVVASVADQINAVITTINDSVQGLGDAVRAGFDATIGQANEVAKQLFALIGTGIEAAVSKVGETLGIVRDGINSVVTALIEQAKATLEWLQNTLLPGIRDALLQFATQLWDALATLEITDEAVVTVLRTVLGMVETTADLVERSVP